MRRTAPFIVVAAMLLAGLPAAALLEAPTSGEDPLETVTIVRDDHGVAHIYADSERALWYANGYVQAQDRLWALDLLRHIGYGEGASVVGESLLSMDLSTRRNLYNETMLEAQWNAAPERFQDAARAYTEGVNRAAHEMIATGDIPAEFPALQHAWHDWEPLDTVAVATFLLAEFGNGGGSEISNAQLLSQLDRSVGDGDGELGSSAPMDAFEDLNWLNKGSAYATIPKKTPGDVYTETPQAGTKTWTEIPEAQKEATRAAAQATPFGLDPEPTGPAIPIPAPPAADRSDPIARMLEDLAELEPSDFRFGSNALLVDSDHSESGKAMFGGGPQMGYFNPQIPYEVGLHLSDGSLEAEGMGVTGAPGVIIGRSANFAWSVTSGISDQTDIVALEAEPFMTQDGPVPGFAWDFETRPLDCRTETHEVFTPPAVGGPAYKTYEQEVCRADLSPIGDPGSVPPAPIVATTTDEAGEPEWYFASKSSSRMLEGPSAVKWLSLPEAKDFEDFAERFEPDAELGSPGFAFTFNFHYAGENADGEQTICYKHVGLQPQRNLDLDPRLPTPAGNAYGWDGFLTGDELPNDCDPEQGYYANWNNLPQQGWSAGDSRELWGSVHRVERLDTEVNRALDNDPDGDGKLSLDQVKTVLREAATRDSLAADIVGAIQAYDLSSAPGADAALATWEDAGFPWNRTTDPNDVVLNETGHPVYAYQGMTVYENVTDELLHQVFDDELEGHVRSVTWRPLDAGDPHAGDHGQHRNQFAVLVDALNGDTEGHDWCDDVTTPATETCQDQIDDALDALGYTGVSDEDEITRTPEHLSPFTSLGVGPAFTMPMTNRATFYHFHVGSDVDESYATLPPGVSGHVNAVDFALMTATGDPPEHMDDQLNLYVNFGFKKLPWTQASAEQGAESSQTLLVPPSLG